MNVEMEVILMMVLGYGIAFLVMYILKKCVINGIITIKKGNKGVVERKGKFYKVLDSGKHIIIPFIDNVVSVIYVKELVREFPVTTFQTHNYKVLDINFSVSYQIVEVKDYYYADGPIRKLEEYSLNRVEDLVSSMDFNTTENFMLYANDKLNFMVLQQDYDIEGIKINKIEINSVVVK